MNTQKVSDYQGKVECGTVCVCVYVSVCGCVEKDVNKGDICVSHIVSLFDLTCTNDFIITCIFHFSSNSST